MIPWFNLTTGETYFKTFLTIISSLCCLGEWSCISSFPFPHPSKKAKACPIHQIIGLLKIIQDFPIHSTGKIEYDKNLIAFLFNENSRLSSLTPKIAYLSYSMTIQYQKPEYSHQKLISLLPCACLNHFSY